MRNYWSLLPAIAVIVVLILVYAVPTLINPQWTSSIMALFRQAPADPHGDSDEARRSAGFLGPQQVRSRRMLASALVVGALALIGFNVSLNREANGCYRAAAAFGAVKGKAAEDPCINMIYGTFIGDGTGPSTEQKPQPVASYQLVRKNKPAYLKWIQNSPGYKDAELLVGTGLSCAIDLRVEESDDKITAVVNSDTPCPAEDSVSLTAIKLKKPVGDRKIVTVDGKPMTEINPDMDSWPTVVKKLLTGG